MTRLGNRFFTEWHKSTLGMHYFKFILQITQYLFSANYWQEIRQMREVNNCG